MSKELVKNAIIKNSPKHIKQLLINSIVENGIGTYKHKSEPNLIQLTHKTMDDKIIECINENELTFKLIDLLEINKGYRYSIIFEYSNVDFDLIKQKCVGIDSDYYNNIHSVSDELQKLYLEDDKHFFMKFHYDIKVIEKTDPPVWNHLRYPILFVFHKQYNLLEVKFDRLTIERDRNFYITCMDTQLYWLGRNADLKYKHINLDKIIRAVLEDYKNCVVQLVWSLETAKSQGMTLKAGENMVMPFFGQLQIEIDKLKNIYESNESAIQCLTDLESYLQRTKKYANDKFTGLKCLKYMEDGQYKELLEPIEFKITFNYSETNKDLICMFDTELNDMERMDYVIDFIGAIRRKFVKTQLQTEP